MINLKDVYLEGGSGSLTKYPTTSQPKSEDKNKYDDLTKKLNEIDKSYSVVYNTPKIDVPTSLDTQKLEYTMPAQDELYKQAEKSIASKYYTKEADIRSTYQKNSNKISDKINQEELNAILKIGDLEQQRDKEKKEAQKSAIKKGLARSSIAQGVLQEAEQEFEREQSNIIMKKDANIGLLKKQIADLQQLTNEALEALGKSRTLETMEVAQKLLSEALKKQDEVIKYNNSLITNDAKYQASLITKMTEAQKNEFKRAEEVRKLLEELGGEGLNDLIRKEKYLATVDYVDGLTKEEALDLLKYRTDLPIALGDYYKLLEQYVKDKK